MDLETTDVHQQVMDMILGFWASQTLRAIADFSVADHLAAGGLTAAEVAAREGTAVDITYRLMRAGVGLGLMTTDADGRFYDTERLATLRKDAPRSLRALTLSFTDPGQWRQWEGFVESLRYGHRESSSALESDFYDDLVRNPDAGEAFSAAMTSATACWTYNIADVIDTTSVERAVDVGGANGSWFGFCSKPIQHCRLWSSIRPP